MIGTQTVPEILWVKTEFFGQCTIHPTRKDNIVMRMRVSSIQAINFCTDCQRAILEPMARHYYRALTGREKKPVGYVGPLSKVAPEEAA